MYGDEYSNRWNFLGARRIANSSNQIRRVLFDWQGIGACTSLFEHSRDNKNSKSKLKTRQDYYIEAI